MKRNNIYTLIVLFFSFILSVIPAFAEGQSIINRQEIRNLLQAEQKNQISNNTGSSYLYDFPLDFLNFYLILYTDNSKEQNYETVSHPMPSGENDPISFLMNKVNFVLANETELPSLFDQFCVMSYLIYTGQNNELKRVLELGYQEDIYVNVYFPDHTKSKNILTQAVLSNNKEALKIISDSMKEKKSALGVQNIDKEMGKVWFGTLQSLIPAGIDEDYQYDQTDLTNKYNYAKENLNAETIAGLIVGAEDGSRIILFQYVDIILNENNGKNAHLFFDALNLLTDRRSQGF